MRSLAAKHCRQMPRPGLSRPAALQHKSFPAISPLFWRVPLRFASASSSSSASAASAAAAAAPTACFPASLLASALAAAAAGAGAANALCSPNPSETTPIASSTSRNTGSTSSLPSPGFPPFTMDGAQHDQTSFGGRLMTMFDVITPASLLVSDAQLAKQQELLDSYSEGKLPQGTTDEQLWQAKASVNAIVHPVTKEKLFLPGRMSMFAFMNIPIAIGMLMHGTTGVAAGIFWQWVNQSMNVVQNYTNRSGATIEMGPLMQAYGLACTAAIGINIGFGKLTTKLPQLAKAGPFIPYLATICAGSTNLMFTRMKELQDGIPVFDQDGRELGTSCLAGRKAIGETILSRIIFVPMAPLLVPPLAMRAVAKAAFFKALPKTSKIMVEVALIAVCMGAGLPMALALKPQKMEIPVEELEEEFRNLRTNAGDAVQVVFANKGL